MQPGWCSLRMGVEVVGSAPAIVVRTDVADCRWPRRVGDRDEPASTPAASLRTPSGDCSRRYSPVRGAWHTRSCCRPGARLVLTVLELGHQAPGLIQAHCLAGPLLA